MLAKKFNTQVLAKLPLDSTIREGGDEGRPVVIREPNSEIAQSFRTLAKSVAGRVHEVIDPASLIQIGKF